MRILVAVASKHGSTWEIARAIGDAINTQGVRADVKHIEDVGSLNVYDGFVLGSAVYAGRWMQGAVSFVRDHAIEFIGRPVWLFSSGPLGFPFRPAESAAVDIRQLSGLVRIKEHRVFAGKIERRHLTLTEKVIAIAAHAPQGDFRNWEEIYAWAIGIATSLKSQAWLLEPPRRAH
jgi:menaquinone-dependent protoporphyrinogen oxidase